MLTREELEQAKREIDRQINTIKNPFTLFRLICSKHSVSEIFIKDRSGISEDMTMRCLVWHDLRKIHGWKFAQIGRFSGRTGQAIRQALIRHARS